MGKARPFCFAAALIAALSPSTTLQAGTNPLLDFQAKEALLFSTGYRLATGNAPFCENRTDQLGFLLHDAEAYGNPGRVRSLLGLSGDIGIQAVVVSSPAYQAGLRQNDTLLTIDGIDVGGRSTSDQEDWLRAKSLNDQLSASARDGTVSITWSNRDRAVGKADIAPVLACPSRFELLSGKRGASADGARVLIGENFPGFAYEESEFAAAVAHEMAHNILRHLDYFEQTGRKQSLVRLSERDADRLMPWLLANAGYDPADAVRFMQRYGPRHGGWIFRKRTHDGWDERVELIEAELPLIQAAQSKDPQGLADWSQHFKEMLSPLPPTD